MGYIFIVMKFMDSGKKLINISSLQREVDKFIGFKSLNFRDTLCDVGYKNSKVMKLLRILGRN
jgi:hypothetical protein